MFAYDSQAVVVDQMMYISGIIGNNPATATLVPGGIEPEADQVYIFMLYHYISSFITDIVW